MRFLRQYHSYILLVVHNEVVKGPPAPQRGVLRWQRNISINVQSIIAIVLRSRSDNSYSSFFKIDVLQRVAFILIRNHVKELIVFLTSTILQQCQYSICAISNSNPLSFSSSTIFLKAGETKYKGSGRSKPCLAPIFCLVAKKS